MQYSENLANFISSPILLPLVAVLFLVFSAFLLLVVIGGYIYFHQLNLPVLEILNSKSQRSNTSKTKVLVLFPHPDDETVSMGSTLAQLSSREDIELLVVSLTAGERGNSCLDLEPLVLAEIRKKEFGQAMAKLGVDNYRIWDYQDGEVENQINSLNKDMDKLLAEFPTDLIITYEKFGIYGHPDHVTLSNFISSYPTSAKKLYITMARRMFLKVAKKNLPLHMAKDPTIVLPSLPMFRSKFSLKHFLRKLKAMNEYRSQGLPNNLLASFVLSQEYFADDISNNANK